MTLLIRDADQLGPALLPGDLRAGLGGGDHLHVVAVGGGQGRLALGLAVHVQSSLAHLAQVGCIKCYKLIGKVMTHVATMIDDLLEAGGLVLRGEHGLADLLHHSVAHLPLSLRGRLLADHLVLVVTLLHKSWLAPRHRLNVSLNFTPHKFS